MRRTARRLAALAALIPLAGCGMGIQPTDVIEAGGPATIDVLPAREARLLLFFLTPDGTLVPVPRFLDDGSAWGGQYDLGPEAARGTSGPDSATGAERVPPAAAKTVAALLDGPNAREREAGLHNAPTLPERAGVEITIFGGVIDAAVDVPLAGVDDLGLRQLVCTVAYAEDEWGRPPVRLSGTDGPRPQASCDTSPDGTGDGPARPTPTVSPAVRPAPTP